MIDLSGWPAVIVLIVLLLAATVACVRLAARRWWDYLLIAAAALALGRPVLLFITGDMSRWLPGWIWSGNGSDAKDQIVLVSAIATLLLPAIGGSLVVLLGKFAWKMARA
jgi:hypothetical protein